MLLLVSPSDAVFSAGEGWIRESSMAHFIAVVVFVLLWRLHRFLGRSLIDDIIDGTLFNHTHHSSDNQNKLKAAAASDEDVKSPLPIVPEEDDVWLQETVPDATAAERRRFFAATGKKKHEAARSLQTYLNWRKQYKVLEDGLVYQSTGNEDLDHWNVASALAFQIRKETRIAKPLPQFVRTYHQLPESEGTSSSSPSSPMTGSSKYLCDRIGARIFHVTPGQMDERLCSTATYATALAIYLDRKVDRAGTERISVVLDVRGGVGWRNLHAAKQLPFIQTTVQLLLQMFPERLSRALVYPVPAAFVWIWTIASQCIEKKTREKIGLLSGTATIESPPPNDQMLAYLSQGVADRLEEERVALFLA